VACRKVGAKAINGFLVEVRAIAGVHGHYALGG
jgi:hypothetical protein